MNGAPVAVWRLGVAGFAAAGVVLAARQYDVWWTALSQLANLAVAVSFVGLAVAEPRSPWLRGALATAMSVVCLAYLPMANGNLTAPWSVLEHVVTPALVLADFVLVGGNQAQVRWWHPPTWLVPLAAYLVWYVDGDLGVYAALDPAGGVVFGTRLAILVALGLGAGYLLYAHGRARRASLVLAA